MKMKTKMKMKMKMKNSGSERRKGNSPYGELGKLGKDVIITNKVR